MRVEVVSCDICGDKDHPIKNVELQVIFNTDQTEGRPIHPYLSKEKIDLCGVCMDKILEGNYVFGSGAQGNNKYHFKKEE